MSSINNVRNLQILCFSKKNKEIKNLKIEKKKWPDIGSYTYYFCAYSDVFLVCKLYNSGLQIMPLISDHLRFMDSVDIGDF